jgi:transposase
VRRYVERVLVRYRYRAYPTPGQTQLLARAFGCARVVFNDALLARQDAYAAGEKISDTQVQRKVVTLAKTTPARQWLGEARVSCFGASVPGRAPRVPELVRLPVRCA